MLRYFKHQEDGNMNAEAEISNLKFRLDMLEQQLQKAVAENSALKKQHEEDQKTILKLQQENRNLHDSVDYLTRKLYGSSSEKTSALKGQIPGQLSLFDEAETEADPEKKEPDLKEAVKAYIRRKYPGQRKDELKGIKHFKRIAELPPGDRFCEVCGSELKPVGEKFVRTEIQFIPAKVFAIDYYQKTYECRKCRKEGKPYMDVAPLPAPVIAHSMASPGTIAWIAHEKFELAVPFYRMEQEWKDLGVALSRATMCNWIIISYRDWLKPFLARMRWHMMQMHYLHCDETPVQVMHEPGRSNTAKSYMWVLSTIKQCSTPIRFFVYEPGRKKEFARKILDGFQGYLHTDAFADYEALPGVTNCFCLIHLRRKFVDCLTKHIENAESTTAGKGIDYCNRVLEEEKKLQRLTAEERKKKREELEKPILDEFFDWVEDKRCITFMGDKLRTALNYAHNHKQEFMNYLEDGNCACHNQICENAIRPFTIGRKNWLFSGSPKGAEASAGYYSIVETAKANGLRPEKYLTYLLSDIPGMDFGGHPEYFDDMMPWNEEVRKLCT